MQAPEETQPSRRPPTLTDYIKNHSNFQKLTPDKINIFRQYVELNPKGLYVKQVRAISRSFTDKCPHELLDEIVTNIITNYGEYVQHQKRIDDSKMRRLGELTTNWQKGRQQRWKDALLEFHERERERSRDSAFRL
jgi:hypothetical protein